MQSSFIPKKPLTGAIARNGSAAFGNFFLFIAILLFIASLVAAGGVFAYQSFLNTAISSKSDSLTKAEAAFDPSTIQDLERLDSRMNNGENLLQRHTAPSALFDLLSIQTLQNVQFTSFDYELQDDGSAQVTLAGDADSFATVALQSDQFNASQSLKNVVFSGITVAANGSVAFTVKADVNPSLLSYEQYIAQNPTAAISTTSASSMPPQINISSTSPTTSTTSPTHP